MWIATFDVCRVADAHNEIRLCANTLSLERTFKVGVGLAFISESGNSLIPRQCFCRRFRFVFLCDDGAQPIVGFRTPFSLVHAGNPYR